MTGTGKIEMRNIHNLISGVAAVGVLIIVGGGAPVMAAESASMDISANVTQPSCTLAFSPASPLSLGTVQSGEFNQNTTILGVKVLTITLANCSLGKSDVSPTISLDGNHPDVNEVPTGVGRSYVFKDSTDTSLTSRGYFIVAARKSNPAYGASDLWKSGDTIFTGTKGGGAGESTSVWLGVSCGPATASGCPVSTLGLALAGSLKATLKFTFAYK